MIRFLSWFGHRPRHYFETRPLPPVRLPDGRLFSSGLDGIWCVRHACWANRCPDR